MIPEQVYGAWMRQRQAAERERLRREAEERERRAWEALREMRVT